MRRAFMFAMILILSLATATFAPAPRPAITGLCFVRLTVTSLDTADKFYGDYLGLPRFNQCWPASTGACYSITPYQDVEILTSDITQTTHMLETIGSWAEDAGDMPHYLFAPC